MTNKSDILSNYHSDSFSANSEISKPTPQSKKSIKVKQKWYLADKLDHQRKVASIASYRAKKNVLRDEDVLLELQEAEL